MYSKNGLYKDDFTGNGVHHLEPDGTPGPAYEDPFTLLTEDAFPHRFYNPTGKVHNVQTGEHIGFQPGKGDKVGKLGDKNGEGTIADYIEGVEPTELVDNTITVTWVDTSGPAEDVDEMFENLNTFFQENPPDDITIDFYGINGVQRDKSETPPDYLEDGNHAVEFYESNVPELLKGPVNYMLLADKKPGKNSALATSPSPGGFGDDAYSNLLKKTFITLHELYWHGLTSKPHLNEGNEETLASPPYGYETLEDLDYLESEWNTILESMNLENREFYESPLNWN